MGATDGQGDIKEVIGAVRGGSPSALDLRCQRHLLSFAAGGNVAGVSRASD